MPKKQNPHKPEIDYLITLPERSEPHREYPTVGIESGILKIEDCACNHINLDLNSAKSLLKLLPSLIAILEPLCSGNGGVRFGTIPDVPLK